MSLQDSDVYKSQLYSTEWGVWGKEKYTLTETAIQNKHVCERNVLKSLITDIPTRLLLGLRYTYGICDLKAYGRPLSKEEFDYLKKVYNEAVKYTSDVQSKGLSELARELYCIHKTAFNIEGFQEGWIFR